MHHLSLRRLVVAACAAALLVIGVPARAALPDPVRFGVVLEAGDLRTAAGWLDEGLDPDFMADRIGSGLMIGAWEGNIPLMELFASRGASINKANQVGDQALMHAAWRGHLAAVKWLVEHGAQVNRENRNWTALHYAVFAGRREVVDYLLAQGADINATTTNGSTPLMMAAREGHEELARVLLERGADASVVNDWGDDAMAWAMRHNNLSIARLVSTPEQFGIAARKPREDFGTARKSLAASPDIEAILREIRLAEAQGGPTEALREQFWSAVSQLEGPRVEMPPAARPALVIRARKDAAGKTRERAELVYEGDRPAKGKTLSRKPAPTGKKPGAGAARAPGAPRDEGR